MAAKNPHRRAESGASGSNQWIATFENRWSSGTTTEPGGKVAVSRVNAQCPNTPIARSTFPPRRMGNRPSNGRPDHCIPEQWYRSSAPVQAAFVRRTLTPCASRTSMTSVHWGGMMYPAGGVTETTTRVPVSMGTETFHGREPYRIDIVLETSLNARVNSTPRNGTEPSSPPPSRHRGNGARADDGEARRAAAESAA